MSTFYNKTAIKAETSHDLAKLLMALPNAQIQASVQIDGVEYAFTRPDNCIIIDHLTPSLPGKPSIFRITVDFPQEVKL